MGASMPRTQDGSVGPRRYRDPAAA
jgi:hypothetical protein